MIEAGAPKGCGLSKVLASDAIHYTVAVLKMTGLLLLIRWAVAGLCAAAVAV